MALQHFQCSIHLPVGVGVVVHEPGAVVVHIHGPRLVIFSQHHVFHGVDPGHAERRVGVVVVAIDADLPIVNALRSKWKYNDWIKCAVDTCFGPPHIHMRNKSKVNKTQHGEVYFGESGGSQHHAVIVAAAADRLVFIG